MQRQRDAYTLWALASSMSDAILLDYVMHDLIPRHYRFSTELNLAVIHETPETIEATSKVVKETAKLVDEIVPSILELIAGTL